jgi:hypothetical protein
MEIGSGFCRWSTKRWTGKEKAGFSTPTDFCAGITEQSFKDGFPFDNYRRQERAAAKEGAAGAGHSARVSRSGAGGINQGGKPEGCSDDARP